MNRKLSENGLRDSVNASLGALDVPQFDLGEIRRRSFSDAARRRTASAPRLRALIAAPVAALLLVALLVNVPAVRAQVERALNAILIVNGRQVQSSVQTVTLDQARTLMPFAVISPAGLPAGLKTTITAVTSDSNPSADMLMIRYEAPDGSPVVTIHESSAAAHGPQQLMISEKRVIGGPAAGGDGDASDAAPSGGARVEAPHGAQAGGRDLVVMHTVDAQNVNGHKSVRQFTFRPSVWIVRGTRIMLAARDGALTPSQIAAIRSAMSR